MDAKPRGRGVPAHRGAAVVGTFFVCGPMSFALWIYLTKPNISEDPSLHVWAAPIAATVFCSFAVLLLPERMVGFIGKMFGWIPYV